MENINKLKKANSQQACVAAAVKSVSSLPADVLWGSFVTHSFLPHGRRPWGRKQMPESLDLFNIFVHGAGERLDQRSKRSLAVVSFRSFIEKPLLTG